MYEISAGYDATRYPTDWLEKEFPDLDVPLTGSFEGVILIGWMVPTLERAVEVFKELEQLDLLHLELHTTKFPGIEVSQDN